MATTKTGPLPLLQPGGERAQQPRRPRVGAVARRAAREALLDLVHPERHRRHAPRPPPARAPAPPRRRPGEPEHARQVEPEQGHAQPRRRRLGGQRLAAALHAHQQHAARRRQPEAGGVRVEGQGPLLHPGLEGLEAAQVLGALGRRPPARGPGRAASSRLFSAAHHRHARRAPARDRAGWRAVKARRACGSVRPRAATRARWRASGARRRRPGPAAEAWTASSSAASSASSGSGRRSTAVSPASPSGSCEARRHHHQAAPLGGEARQPGRAASGPPPATASASWKSSSRAQERRAAPASSASSSATGSVRLGRERLEARGARTTPRARRVEARRRPRWQSGDRPLLLRA